MSPIVEIVAPARLGRSFRWLLSSTVINNVGRAIVLVALVATLVTGTVNIVIVLVALFVLGTALVRVRRFQRARGDPLVTVRQHHACDVGEPDRPRLR